MLSYRHRGFFRYTLYNTIKMWRGFSTSKVSSVRFSSVHLLLRIFEELKEMESSLFLKGLFKKISVWIRYEKPLKYSQKKLSCLDFMFQSKRSFENEQANAYTYEVFVYVLHPFARFHIFTIVKGLRQTLYPPKIQLSSICKVYYY